MSSPSPYTFLTPCSRPNPSLMLTLLFSLSLLLVSVVVPHLFVFLMTTFLTFLPLLHLLPPSITHARFVGNLWPMIPLQSYLADILSILCVLTHGSLTSTGAGWITLVLPVVVTLRPLFQLTLTSFVQFTSTCELPRSWKHILVIIFPISDLGRVLARSVILTLGYTVSVLLRKYLSSTVPIYLTINIYMTSGVIPYVTGCLVVLTSIHPVLILLMAMLSATIVTVLGMYPAIVRIHSKIAIALFLLSICLFIPCITLLVPTLPPPSTGAVVMSYMPSFMNSIVSSDHLERVKQGIDAISTVASTWKLV